MHSKHGTQVTVRAILVLVQAFDGVVLHVGLGEAEIELPSLDGVDIEHGAARRFNRAANAVFGPVLVHQTADRASGCVIHASDATRAYGHKLLLGHGRRGGKHARQRSGGSQGFQYKLS